MRKNIIFAALLVVLAPSAIVAQTAGYYDRSYVRMSYVQGDVYVQRGQDLGFQAGEVNLVVVAGDKIGTRAGRLELQLGRQNYLRLDNDTVIEMAALPGADGEPTKVHLLAGSIFVRVHALDGARNFEIDSPDASFYILGEGLYRLDVRDGRESALLVLEGEAEASGEQGSLVARSGESLVAADGRFVENPSALAASGDDFSSWNNAREAVYARPVGQSYLPAEYAEYEPELADSGSWTYESDYGYVWVPRVRYDDWRPYSYGHWTWYPIIGWTWISDEPWGWCTSHYGRWGWGSHLGWYWIPQSHWGWGPAWVHWYWDSSYIGWSPLSYWGYPCHLVNNRFYDRYTGYGFPNGSRSLMMVRRDQLQARNLRGGFLAGESLNRVGRNNLRNGQPDLKPNLVRSGDIATRARGTLAGASVRGVTRSFGQGVSRPAPETLRPNVIRRMDSGARSERANPGTLERGTPGSRIIRQGETAASRASSEAAAPRRALDPAGPARALPQYPSRQNPARGTSETVNRSGGATARTPEVARPGSSGTEGRTIRENPSRPAESRTIRENPSRSEESRAIRPNPTQRPAEGRSTSAPARTIRTPETGASTPSRALRSPSGAASFPSRSTGSASRNTANTSSSSSRILRAPAGSGSSASSSVRTPRITTSPSRSRVAARPSGGSAPSLSAPSRSSASRAPARTLSSPSRSPQGSSGSAVRSRQSSGSTGSSSPSRSLSSPSRSSSSPSRSVSAPSRSSSSSRSSSGASRSSGSVSRSSGGSSRSSSGGGRIRK